MRFRRFLLILTLLAVGDAGLGLLAGAAADGEIHLIPQGYVGEVFIVYGASAGPPAEFDDQGRRVYRVPPSGVVLTPLSSDIGEANTEDVQFHAVDSQGRREAIAKGWLSDNPGVRTDQFRIFSGSAGQTDLYDINCRIVTKSYYVGTLNDLDAKVGMIDIEQYFRSNPALCPPLEQ